MVYIILREPLFFNNVCVHLYDLLFSHCGCYSWAGLGSKRTHLTALHNQDTKIQWISYVRKMELSDYSSISKKRITTMNFKTELYWHCNNVRLSTARWLCSIAIPGLVASDDSSEHEQITQQLRYIIYCLINETLLLCINSGFYYIC